MEWTLLWIFVEIYPSRYVASFYRYSVINVVDTQYDCFVWSLVSSSIVAELGFILEICCHHIPVSSPVDLLGWENPSLYQLSILQEVTD